MDLNREEADDMFSLEAAKEARLRASSATQPPTTTTTPLLQAPILLVSILHHQQAMNLSMTRLIPA
ncbi:hypothetical protein HBI52_139170 [Parastagonospora nodorum]|nr:hypothetical protein HBH54_216310 [Parastagonospora nodorum]KAH4127538.1 hypothetical protein HBH45_214300 [Parastagonospora nodorum]KAH4149062.1 hypothetical protein HBH44_202990 [Parastagonospora nodorum]KAH4218202.1 hypothetical protein HBI06_202850 [Parastagonospora nodorum]KAH5509009.1 hypothetical protein HBI52_139170 [Parastagonospora nodorum]